MSQERLLGATRRCAVDLLLSFKFARMKGQDRTASRHSLTTLHASIWSFAGPAGPVRAERQEPPFYLTSRARNRPVNLRPSRKFRPRSVMLVALATSSSDCTV